MSQSARDNKILVFGEEARDQLSSGIEDMYRGVAMTYGPKGRPMMLERVVGYPIVTRDGVTVARDIYFRLRGKNMGAQSLLQASEQSNRIAGDGTTATIALAYHLIKEGMKRVRADVHEMVVSDIIKADADLLAEEIKKLAKPTKKSQLKQVATVSSGSPLLGELIAGAVERVGADGGIIAEKSMTSTVEREFVDGYYLQSGFTAIQSGKKELEEPRVLVVGKRVASGPDILELLTNAIKATGGVEGTIPKFLIIGQIEDQAYQTVVDNLNGGKLDAIVVKTPPQYGSLAKELLEDIATYCGCEVITENLSLKDVSSSHVGVVGRAVATKSESTLFGDNTGEIVQDRITKLRSQLENETVDSYTEKLRDRISKLEGKVAIFKIGAPTDMEKEELEYRIEDAVLATRAAFSHGVVPGGGSTLLELSKLTDLSDITRSALRSVFQQLLINANLPAELKLAEALQAKTGQGFNLRAGDNLVDMVEAGILDPLLVVEQTIKNASSVASTLIMVGGLSLFEDRKED